MADLAGKPPFDAIAEEFLAFIDGAKLVAHNAGFDVAFINAELARLGHPPVTQDRVVDTLAIARRKHPMGPNSLDALCRRYGIDNSHRTKHGALLDSELLAEVYLELIGGKQGALGLEVIQQPRPGDSESIIVNGRHRRQAAAAGAAHLRKPSWRLMPQWSPSLATRRSGGVSAESKSPAIGRA